jgi:hypothetical protein
VPVITKLRVTRRVRAGHSARVRFLLDRAATVTLTVKRRHAHVSRTATLAVAGKLGVNKVKLSSKLLGRRAGAYRVTATPATHATTGSARSKTLRIRPRR